MLDSCHCSGFSLQSMDSRARGLSSCSPGAPEHRLHSCGAWARLLQGKWDHPGSGLKPVSPVLAGRVFTTEPAGQPHTVCCFADGDTGAERQDALLRDAQPSGVKLHPSMQHCAFRDAPWVPWPPVFPDWTLRVSGSSGSPGRWSSQIGPSVSGLLWSHWAQQRGSAPSICTQVIGRPKCTKTFSQRRT